jgi:cob(I)alamin adenosyltransferase
MKIYTKKGDDGTTALIGGVRVKKSNSRINAYGTVDELNSFVGLIRAESSNETVLDVLGEIQDRLFTIGSLLASHPSSKMIVPDLNELDLELLEGQIDEMNQVLPELKSFILPGGSVPVANCHIARCVCRRAERLAVELADEEEIDPILVKYLNRLSDYLFVLARFKAYTSGEREIAWRPRT